MAPVSELPSSHSRDATDRRPSSVGISPVSELPLSMTAERWEAELTRVKQELARHKCTSLSVVAAPAVRAVR
eukprot:510555-Prymnesium_polylepis.1